MAYTYNKPGQPSAVERIDPSLRPPWKQATDDPCL